MKIAIINSTGFWSMGWTTDAPSQQDAINALTQLGITVSVHEVKSRTEADTLFSSFAKNASNDPCLLWPNAYQVHADNDTEEPVWLADLIESYGLPIIGNQAKALKNVMHKDQCQQLLDAFGASIPGFIAVEAADIDFLAQRIHAKALAFPLFVKPNSLSTSKGITQNNVVHNLEQLQQQVVKVGEQFGFPVMVEEYLPGQDITVSVFMTGDTPTFLPTYYDTKIYDDPGAVLDHAVRMRDWNDGKWLRVVEEPEVLQKIAKAAIPACQAAGINEFTRLDCRFDRNGELKVFDVNGMPGLELPFSTTVWQMIVKLHDHTEQDAFKTLLSLVLYCVVSRYSTFTLPEKAQALAHAFIQSNQIATDEEPAAV